jgi:antitoxin CptB
MSDAPIPSRLRWRCRRGMQELDVLLGRWLESRWGSANPDTRQAFEELLECEDDLVWVWLMGRADPDPVVAGIVDEIRELGFGDRAD